MDPFRNGADTLFILLGAIMILAMHAGFAFLELGTVRKKNQVNALVKILVDFAISTIAYFFVGYGIAYGVHFFQGADVLAQKNGFELVKFFFLLTFAAAIPAIISGGIAERARFNPQLAATALMVGLVYPLFEGIAWNNRFGIQPWLEANFAAGLHCRRCCCSARATVDTRKTVACPRTSPRAFPSSRSARGYLRWAGSAST